ncbi:MAG: alpha-L-fucosidase, partial [Cyclobacteriaceae bacterium]|nr:alpha-L-fucosidase [Cyclobacteriaceae bacterium]
MKPVKILVVVSLLLSSVAFVHAQGTYTPSADNLAAREWFQKARFGLFIHWGVYSVLGDGEWVMNNQQIPVATYEKLPSFFNPIEFDPKEWVDMAREAGMKYI